MKYEYANEEYAKYLRTVPTEDLVLEMARALPINDSKCICIQDESRDWINCPVHGEKLRKEQLHNQKIREQIAKIARDKQEWASKHNWPVVGGPITTFITMWQCPHCYLPTLVPQGHNEWHERNGNW